MARRRGNKRRRDVKRDSSVLRRAAKVGAVVSSVAAGGYALSNSQTFKKFIQSGAAEGTLKATKGFRKDLLNKPKNLYSLRSAYDRNIGRNGEKIKETAKKLKNVKKVSNTKLGRNTINIAQSKDKLLKKFKEAERQNVISSFKDKITSTLDKDRQKEVNDVIDALFYKATETNIEDGTLLEKYKTARKTLKMEDDEIKDFLHMMIKHREDYSVDDEYINKSYEKLAQKVQHDLQNDILNSNKETFFDRVIDKLTGTRAMRVKDLQDFDDLDFGRFNMKHFDNSYETLDMTERIKSYANDKRLNNMIIDRGLRISVDENGKKIIQDQREIVDDFNNLLNRLKDTTPGKILLKNFDLGDKHDYGVLLPNKYDLNAFLTGAEDNVTKAPMVYLKGSLFGVTKDANGIASLNEFASAEVREVTGWRAKVVHELLGSQQQALEAYDNPVAKMLDINQDGAFNIPRSLDRMISNTTLGEMIGAETDPNWEKNQLRNMKEFVNTTTMDGSIKGKAAMYDNAVTTSYILNRNITGVSDELIDNLIKRGRFSESENSMLSYLLDGTPDSVNEFIFELGRDPKSIKNRRLRSTVEGIARNTESMENMQHISIKEGQNRLMDFITGMPIEEQWKRNELGQLRVEYVKEIMLNRGLQGDGYMQMIDEVAGNSTQRKILDNIGMLGLFEQYMDVGDRVLEDASARFLKGGQEDYFITSLHNNPRLLDSFNQIMDEAIADFSPAAKQYMGGINELDMYNEYNDLTFVRKSALNPKNIIEQINKSITNEDVSPVLDMVKNGFKEIFTAGRYDPEHVTEATLLAQYSMSRLNYSLEEFGLNLSSDSMSSPLHTYLSFGLKRVLPIAAGVKTFEYLNDESRRFLGSSMTEAMARGVSYIDIGMRDLAYKTPIGSVLNNWAETSVIHEYYFGDNKFDTSEERADWYENGYSPVRKGRFWSFGSTSEYRGGAISYWQPNYLRRAESNYHDISVYGSSEEKWAHSWIPTPTHPLSTIRAALNPYWLEKKHLEEGDRPYPLTAKMFSEGTPWGAILNPTIGEILKPVRMLPEARLRLGHNGRDSKAAINRINERIKSKDQSNDDLLIISGTDIRNGEYIPFGNPVSGEMNFTVRNGDIQSQGYGFMDSIDNIGEYEVPTGNDFVQQTKAGSRVVITGGDPLINPNMLKGLTEGEFMSPGERIGRNIINTINNAIKQPRGTTRINNSSNSTYIYRNLVNEYNNYVDDYVSERYDPTMINRSMTYDYIRDSIYSATQIGGMYGYLGRMITGSDHSYTYRFENAGQMASFSRSFWDASIGGMGGGPMEIARRFFPSEQRNRISVNPLVNNMPDWIPDSYRTGDPYTNIPKGEARLPGRGYESLNDLHPDMFGDYGAFDRFKILADIAPNSTEYKKWRNIARATITDKALQEEIKEIAERTGKMSGNHEFFEYKYIKNGTKYDTGIVKSISGSQITLTDNTVLTLAGVSSTNRTNGALSDMIAPGMEISYRHNRNKGYDKDNAYKNFTVASVVYAPGSSESINRMLIDSGAAEKDVDDNSTLASLGRISARQEVSGAIQEIIAHAHIPIVHNKFLRVDSAYESYIKETVIGSNFKTWDHPIKGFVKPLFNEQSNKSIFSEISALGVAYRHFSSKVYSADKTERFVSNVLLATTNPTAFLFGNMAFIMNMANGSKGKGSDLTDWQKGAKIGVALGTAKYAWDNADNPFKATASMAGVGALLSTKRLGWEAIEDVVGKMTLAKGAAIGAGIGLTMSAFKNSRFDKEKMFGNWVPKETRKKWDLDEYFDRLEYMKYSGLYEQAAKKARRKEKVDIEGIFKEIDKNKKKINKLNRKAAKLAEKSENSTDKYANELAKIENKKRLLQEQEVAMYKGGEWTKSAIAYKKAMESTMYGLDASATKDELLASVPDQYKDYFTAFMDVTDKREQKKILKSVSPMMRRPLQAAWGMKLERVKSNKSFFKVHAMPGVGWRGWKPNVNLKYVKMKTIQNEGMLLSDFGYYESEKAKANFEDAPEIENYDNGRPLRRAKIASVMRGHGLHLHNISVEPTRAPGIKIIGDVRDKTGDRVKTTGYGLSKMAYRLGSLF